MFSLGFLSLIKSISEIKHSSFLWHFLRMEVANNNKLPFIGMELIKIGKQLKTCVYRKTTNKGLLLHYQSHADARYKRSLLMTMLNRAHCLSSSTDLFAEECDNLIVP